MKSQCKYIFFICNLLLGVSSCDRNVNETVETAYQLPLPEPLIYKFERNGGSSVDLLESTLITEPVNYVFSYLKEAKILNQAVYEDIIGYYQIKGMNGVVPYEEIAKSKFQKNNRDLIRQEITMMINESARISGYQSENIRNREAKKGVSGYVGTNLGDLSLSFVDEKGLAPAEAFYYMMLGGIQMDKIFGTHLSDKVLNDTDSKKHHENLILLKGRNYTMLENHWDLSYGYYEHLRSIVRADGLPILRHSETNIYNAFVQGRYEIGRFYYDEMNIQASTIRSELAKAIAVKTMNLLVGNNTIANLKENEGFSFKILSQAYGLIYSLQFLRNNSGDSFFTREQIHSILQSMTADGGFWERERLLADENMQGSLKQIAVEIGKPFGVTLNDIKR